MPGTKRSADDAGASTRASKANKTSDATTASSKAKKGGKKAKAVPAASAFKKKAKPFHVVISSNAPSEEENEATDTGRLGVLRLSPTVFSTGSYGWKGNKRFAVEIPSEGDETEKVQVIFSINATVVGSKGGKAGAGEIDDDDNKDETEGAKEPQEDSEGQTGEDTKVDEET